MSSYSGYRVFAAARQAGKSETMRHALQQAIDSFRSETGRAAAMGDPAQEAMDRASRLEAIRAANGHAELPDPNAPRAAWVNKSVYDADVRRLTQERDEARRLLEQKWSVAGDYVSGEQHLAEVMKLRDTVNRLRGDYETVEQRIDALKATNSHLRGEVARLEGKCRDLEERPQFWSDEAACMRLEEENRALRAQLALAEERRRPARHRPGEVRVGWDPEGD